MKVLKEWWVRPPCWLHLTSLATRRYRRLAFLIDRRRLLTFSVLNVAMNLCSDMGGDLARIFSIRVTLLVQVQQVDTQIAISDPFRRHHHQRLQTFLLFRLHILPIIFSPTVRMDVRVEQWGRRLIGNEISLLEFFSRTQIQFWQWKMIQGWEKEVLYTWWSLRAVSDYNSADGLILFALCFNLFVSGRQTLLKRNPYFWRCLAVIVLLLYCIHYFWLKRTWKIRMMCWLKMTCYFCRLLFGLVRFINRPR